MILLSNRLSRTHTSIATSTTMKPRIDPTGAASGSRRVLRGGAVAVTSGFREICGHEDIDAVVVAFEY